MDVISVRSFWRSLRQVLPKSMGSFIPDEQLRLDIIIVGAGLSGLSAAIACALSGHNVTIIESARELAEVGAGLQITPNAARLFESWGIMKRLESSFAEPTVLTVRRYSDGKILAQEKDFNIHMRQKYGAPFVDMHRVDVQRALAQRAQELGAKLVLGQRVQSIDFDKGELTSKDGSKFRGDLIVAADGLWSKSRECFLKSSDPPLPTGDLAYRIVLSLDQIKDPELRSWVENPTCNFWAGPGSHVVAYSVRGGQQYNVVLLVPDDLPENVAKQTGSVDEMKKLFTGWDPILNRFLDCVSEVDKWKLMHRPELPSWINDKYNFVMIGDACHPMLPYLAQGANSSMEDGAVLGGLLQGVKSQKDVGHRLEIFQSLRKKRGEAIVRETFKQREAFHMPDGPEQEKRDELFMKYLGREVDIAFPSRWSCPEVQPWLYGYNAEKEVADALAKLQTQAHI